MFAFTVHVSHMQTQCYNDLHTVCFQPAGSPLGIETKLRVSQSSNCWVTLESVKEPGNFVCIDQTGRSVAAVYSLAPTAQVQANRQITPKLLVCWPHLYQNHNQLNQSDDFFSS